MGQLIYAGGSNIGLSDEALVYLEALTRGVLSSGKSFAVVIAGDIDGVVAARTLWFSPHTPVEFNYQDYETVQIDRESFNKLYESVLTSGVHFVGDGPLPYEFTGGEETGGTSD